MHNYVYVYVHTYIYISIYIFVYLTILIYMTVGYLKFGPSHVLFRHFDEGWRDFLLRVRMGACSCDSVRK